MDYKIASAEEAKLGFLYQNPSVRERQGLKKMSKSDFMYCRKFTFWPARIIKIWIRPIFYSVVIIYIISTHHKYDEKQKLDSWICASKGVQLEREKNLVQHK